MQGCCAFPTSLCGVLVFRLDPAAPLPVLAAPAAPSSQITPHSSQLHFSSQLITAPLIITTHHGSTSHTSLITSQLITAPLLRPHFSHTNSSQLHFSHLTSHTLTHHSSTSHTTTHHSSSHLTYHISHLTAFRVAGAVHEPPGRAAARVAAAGPRLPFRVAGAVHRASWSSCGARGRR